MDTEEAQEFNREIVAKATEKELRKQRYAQKRQQTTGYDFPRPGFIPVPQLEKSKEKKESRPQSVLSNFGTPNYEEISMYSEDHLPGQGQSQPHHWSQKAPNKEKESQGARPKIPSSNISAFQDYTSDMMRALNNPWVPKGRKTTTPSWTKVAPLVYLSPTKLVLIYQLWIILN